MPKIGKGAKPKQPLVAAETLAPFTGKQTKTLEEHRINVKSHQHDKLREWKMRPHVHSELIKNHCQFTVKRGKTTGHTTAWPHLCLLSAVVNLIALLKTLQGRRKETLRSAFQLEPNAKPNICGQKPERAPGQV